MMGHRSGFTVGSAPIGAQARPGNKPVDPQQFPGYSYLLAKPDALPADLDAETRTTIGADPAKARDILTALYSLLPLGQLEENPRIPSG